ncbi:hypothetical protein A33M_3806 [Rhodovulum sp. PH10]|nr:hypothetical protein A33M_3806 [Rhodovulum sp. PH10]
MLEDQPRADPLDPPEEEHMASMKIADLKKLLEREPLVPQAIVGEAIDLLAKHAGFPLESGQDDFDCYDGAGFELDGMPFALMRYQGHPADSSTIYLPRHLRDVADITAAVHRITSRLNIPDTAIVWERRDGPDL